MVPPRPVASLATYAAFEKRRGAKAILRALDRLEAAGVALQAPGPHGPREMDEGVLTKAW